MTSSQHQMETKWDPRNKKEVKDLFSFLTSISDEEVVDVVVRVGIASLQGEDGRVWRCIELDDGLHGQWPVDEVRRLVIDILHLNNHALIVRV